jgi:hypothetical protein
MIMSHPERIINSIINVAFHSIWSMKSQTKREKNETKKTIYLNVQSAIILTLFPSPSFGYGDFLFIFLNIYSDKKITRACVKRIFKNQEMNMGVPGSYKNIKNRFIVLLN